MVTGNTKGRKAFRVFNYTFLTLAGLMFALPYLLILIASFSAESAFLKQGYTLFPSKLSIEAYKTILAPESGVFTALKSSLTITAGGVLLQVTVTMLAAYSLSKKKLVGRKGIMGVIIFSMLFSGGLIPSYIWIAGTLNLKNSYFAVLLPSMLSPWNCILMRNYFSGIPVEMEEAAKIDGCGNWRTLLSIFLPVSVPMLATITLFSAVAYWNMWAEPILYFDSNHEHMLPLTAYLRNLIQQEINPTGGRGVSETVKMATTVVATLPIILVYPLLQRYFMSGLMLGSVKG